MEPIRYTLAKKICDYQKQIDAWFKDQTTKTPLPYNSSVDLRDSGFKIAPVDCNLFPAGFNNICEADLTAAPGIVSAWFSKYFDQYAKNQRILIIPEENTRNHFYAENLSFIIRILENASFEVQVGWTGDEDQVELESISGHKTIAKKVGVSDGKLTAGDFIPDYVILNNDFSGGEPDFLQTISQPVLPSPLMSWKRRKKFTHFEHYNRLATEFANLIEIDPWTLTVETKLVDPVNFNEDQGLDDVAKQVDSIVQNMKTVYEKKQISSEPNAFVKSNQGTYGMGIMQAQSGEELLSLNRRKKNKMSVGKNRMDIGSVIVQEGIPTSTLYEDQSAEPVIYLIGCELIGGFLRTNPERGANDNLNSKGMVLKKFCMSDLQIFLQGNLNQEPKGYENHLFELVYGSVARLSALASGYEIQEAKSS